MSYRDILVEMDGGVAASIRVRLAAGLARKFGSRLIGVFAKARIPPPYLPSESALGLTTAQVKRIYDAYDQTVRTASETARAAFESVAADAGVQSDWHELDATGLEDLIDCARRIDLVVASAEGGPFLSTAKLAISSGSPVLIAPEAPVSGIGKHVLVAWNGSREAARALRASWPFLMAAERGGLGGPDGFLQRHFEHHGVRPNLIVDPRDDASAGEIIRDQAGALGADLVVMGLYGRSRLEEVILGGASREMLKHGAIPLLISH